MWLATLAHMAEPLKCVLGERGRPVRIERASANRRTRLWLVCGRDVRAPSDELRLSCKLFFPARRVCDKSLRHETTTTAVIGADFASRSFLLHIRDPHRRATADPAGIACALSA